MDSLHYDYYAGTNRLRRIRDSVPANGYNDPKGRIVDIDGQPDNNYGYDAIGNLIKDSAEKISSIKWNVYGKIQEITKNESGAITTIKYTYDASGNRISQTVNSPSDDPVITWYVRDAQSLLRHSGGNIMSTYTAKGNASDLEDLTLKQSGKYLYGSSRLGLITLDDPDVDGGGPSPMRYYFGAQGYERGDKEYELTNHLGNVLATISDRKFGVTSGSSSLISYYEPHIVTAQDYYPFGMLSRVSLPNSGKTYKFGFNGQEKSNEIASEGNHTTALFGEYDARTGRRWNPDPKPSDGVSIYSVFLNNPIWRNDILLDTPTVKQAALMADNSYSKFDPNNKQQLELKKMGWNRAEKIKTNLFGTRNQEVSLDDIGAVTGYNIALYSRTLNGKTEWVLANAGTADVIDVGSDARNLTGSSDQYAFSVRFAKSLQNGMGGQEMTYVGHSLGGGLAASNSLATGNAAITFNPAGVSWGTRMANNLPKDKRNGQIQSFVVGGEAIDRSQRLVGSKANGQVTYIHPQLGKIGSGTALYLRWSTDVTTSVQYHMMSTVMQSLNKAGIK